MFEIVKAIREALGIESTWAFVSVIAIGAALLAGLLAGGTAWIVDKGYKKSLANHPVMQQSGSVLPSDDTAEISQSNKRSARTPKRAQSKSIGTPSKPKPLPLPSASQSNSGGNNVQQNAIGGSIIDSPVTINSSPSVIYNYDGSFRKRISGGNVIAELRRPDPTFEDISQKMQDSATLSAEARGFTMNESLTRLKQLIKDEPQWASPHVLSGLAYLNLGKIEAAKAELKAARNLVPPGYEYESDYEVHFRHLEDAIKRHEPTQP